jgi:hypothetical protein
MPLSIIDQSFPYNANNRLLKATNILPAPITANCLAELLLPFCKYLAASIHEALLNTWLTAPFKCLVQEPIKHGYIDCNIA